MAPDETALGTNNSRAARSSGLGSLALASVCACAAAAILLACTDILDADLGRHVAFGRILLHDFGSVRHLTFGQGPAILQQAYSYWLYQILVATLFDGLGPWAVVLLRAVFLVIGFSIPFLLARKQGADLWACAVALFVALFLSQERFLDRPELFSFVAWGIALWILSRHRHDSRVWALVGLQVVWVNTHIWFGLLLALTAAFYAADRIERTGNVKRAARVVIALVLATFVNPHGPAAWRSQFYLVQFLSKNYSLPFQIGEMMSPLSSYQVSPAVWTLRIGLPLILLAAIAARRRIGWQAIFVLVLAGVLSLRARRAMPLRVGVGSWRFRTLKACATWAWLVIGTITPSASRVISPFWMPSSCRTRTTSSPRFSTRSFCKASVSTSSRP